MNGADLNASMTPQNPKGGNPNGVPQQQLTSSTPTSPESTTPKPLLEAPKSSKKLIVILVIILILALIGAGGYYYLNNYKKSTEETSTTTYTSPTTSQSTIESNYRNASAIEPTSNKSKAVNNIFQPILKNVFNNEVKMIEDLGAMMTYVVNRKITTADVSATQAGLEAIGYNIIDSSEKQLTVSKGPYTWVITFTVGNENKAVIEITY